MTARQLWFPLNSDLWIEVKDGNDTARTIFDNHYSRYWYKDGRRSLLFVGPGEKMVLVTPDSLSLFVWRKFISADQQAGINCAIFRNENPGVLSSKLILAAEVVAQSRWPGERMYTYVNPHAIRSINPGCCFKRAGWRRCGTTKTRRLYIFEKLPQRVSRSAHYMDQRNAGATV